MCAYIHCLQCGKVDLRCRFATCVSSRIVRLKLDVVLVSSVPERHAAQSSMSHGKICLLQTSLRVLY